MSLAELRQLGFPSFVLEPDLYLVEIDAGRPCNAATLSIGLGRQGWDPIVVDQEIATGPRSESPTVGRLRFIGRLNQRTLMADGPNLRWVSAKRITVPVFGNLRYELEPFVIETGKTYELYFVSRMKSHPGRAGVEGALKLMGFEPLCLSALKKDTRIPGHPGASATIWYGVGRWTGPASHITMEDPFYFEEVREVQELLALSSLADQPDREQG